MILEFRTKPNVYGNCRYMKVDTDTKRIQEQGIAWGYMLSVKDFKQLEEQLKNDGFKVVIQL